MLIVMLLAFGVLFGASALRPSEVKVAAPYPFEASSSLNFGTEPYILWGEYRLLIRR